MKPIHNEQPPLNPETRENYVRRFGLHQIEPSRLQKLMSLIDYKLNLDKEVKRLKTERASYTDRRIAGVCTHFGIHVSDLVDKPIADLVRGCLDSEDYVTTLRRAKEAQ